MTIARHTAVLDVTARCIAESGIALSRSGALLACVPDPWPASPAEIRRRFGFSAPEAAPREGSDASPAEAV